MSWCFRAIKLSAFDLCFSEPGASFILIAFGDNEFRSFYRSRAVYYPIKYESIIKAHYIFIYI